MTARPQSGWLTYQTADGTTRVWSGWPPLPAGALT